MTKGKVIWALAEAEELIGIKDPYKVPLTFLSRGMDGGEDEEDESSTIKPPFYYL